MNIILLSGGSGKRLWPLSNEIRSKQFIKLFRGNDGTYESMAQRVFRQIREVDSDANITIATSRSQVSALHNQLGESVGISVEPCRRDTFPAIVLAAAYLTEVQCVDRKEPVIICPVDPYVDNGYFDTFNTLERQVRSGQSNLVLMGIEPTYPSEKYGYIIPKDGEAISEVKEFKEKPDTESALRYIRQGALWNGGVFACRLEYLLIKAQNIIGLSRYQELISQYEKLPKISFDYAVVEKEPRIQVVRYEGKWKDLGTWNTFTEEMEEASVGKAELDASCRNVHIVNELDIPILVMGMQNVVVSASPQGILVSDKEASSYIKPHVDRLDQQVMFAEKSWGTYQVLSVAENSLTIKVTLNSGHKMNYHYHRHRDEVWVVTAGEGKAVVNGVERDVKPSDVIIMNSGDRHMIEARSRLELIEVQIGEEISREDKVKCNWPYT